MKHANNNVRQPSRILSFEDAVQIQILLLEGHLQSRIAPLFDVNAGRISEINTGQKHAGSRAEAMRRRNAA
jgi:hypothetical protein